MFTDGDAQHGITVAAVDVDGFDAFYLSTARRTLALARSLTRSWTDAEDLVQDAYADAHRRWSTVSGLEDPAAWVRRAVLNRSASRWRRLGREVRALTRFAARASAPGGETELHDAEFWRCVAALPRQQARAVALFYVDDRSIEQIAVELGCSTGSVKTHLSRARTTLFASLSAGSDREEPR